MTITYSLTKELRAKLKEPFGAVIQGSFAQTMIQLEEIIETEKPPMIIAVGDVVSENLHVHAIKTNIAITDNKNLRQTVPPQSFPDKQAVQIKNPQGTITQEAITTIQKALENNAQTHIVVDGEEDLLTIVATLHAPEGALIVYGQPYEGIVVVKVNTEKQSQAKKILDEMKKEEIVE
ncbi:MAG: DUF359 domain-containing protein [Candidatus Bathyarchaeota archaeon]|nr:DUF359 domain-containing protein [Candidatus Bathyarchaeota archaeon]